MQLQYVVGTKRPARPSQFDWGRQPHMDILENERLEQFANRVKQQQGLDKTDEVPCRLHICQPGFDRWVPLDEEDFTKLTPDHRLYVEAVDGLSNVELLRFNPMPPREDTSTNYHPASSGSSSSEYRYHPEWVIPWDWEDGKPSCEAIKQHTAGVTASGYYHKTPEASWLRDMGTKEGLVMPYLKQVIWPVERVCMYDSVPCTYCRSVGISPISGSWTAIRSHQRIYSQQDNADFIPPPPTEKPGFQLLQRDNSKIRAFVEVQRSEALKPAELCPVGLAPLWSYAAGQITRADLLQCFPSCQQQPANEAAILRASTKVGHVLSKTYMHMGGGGLRYSAITTYDNTWLLCCKEPGILMVSRSFGLEDTEPTPREALYWMSHMALGAEGVGEPWQGLAAPGREDSHVQTRPGGSEMSDGSHRASSSSGARHQQQEQQQQQQGVTDDEAINFRPAAPLASAYDQDPWLQRHSVHLPCGLTANLYKPLGCGACGTVFHGRWQKGSSTAVEVAVKAGSAPDVVRMLQHEASMYSQLRPAQGLVVPRVFSHGPGKNGRGYYIATQLIHGHKLNASSLPQSARDAALEALKVVHNMGVLHGDLREANILVEGNKVWLIDFSHARRDADNHAMAMEEEIMRALCSA